MKPVKRNYPLPHTTPKGRTITKPIKKIKLVKKGLLGLAIERVALSKNPANTAIALAKKKPAAYYGRPARRKRAIAKRRIALKYIKK